MDFIMPKGRAIKEKKIVSISSKRQITIPLKFFSMLGFDDEAECVGRGNELVIRPIRSRAGGELEEQILRPKTAKFRADFDAETVGLSRLTSQKASKSFAV